MIIVRKSTKALKDTKSIYSEFKKYMYMGDAFCKKFLFLKSKD